MLKSLHERPLICMATLCALYAAQGMPDGFVRVGLKTYLIDEGVSTDAVGKIVALVSWPWALKWIWGPIIDRFSNHSMGRRRPWILMAQSGIGVTLGAMLLIPDLPSSLRLLSLMILLANVFASLQDVSVDAMAIDQLPEKKRGLANGLMFGSSYLGSYIGAFLLGSLLISHGLAATVSVQIGILFLLAMFPLFFKERRADAFFSTRFIRPGVEAIAAPSTRELFVKLLSGFSVRSSWLAAIFSLSSLVAVNAYLIVWPVYLTQNLGWTSEEYLRLEGGLSIWFGLIGAVGGGAIASKIGTKRSVSIAVLLVAALWFTHGWLASNWHSSTLVTSLFLAVTAATGFLQVSMFSMFMGIAWKPIAATQFTAYMAMLNLSNGVGARLAGTMEATFSMPTLFAVFGVYQLMGLLILFWIDPSETRRVLGESESTEKDI